LWAFDAERLDNLLPADKLYDAIVMNPPFSATA
jgi:16S rRNA G1207 methylase RsmC